MWLTQILRFTQNLESSQHILISSCGEIKSIQQFYNRRSRALLQNINCTSELICRDICMNENALLHMQIRKLIKIPALFGKIVNLCMRGIHPSGVRWSREVVTQKLSDEKGKCQTTETLMQWCGQVKSMIIKRAGGCGEWLKKCLTRQTIQRIWTRK